GDAGRRPTGLREEDHFEAVADLGRQRRLPQRLEFGAGSVVELDADHVTLYASLSACLGEGDEEKNEDTRHRLIGAKTEDRRMSDSNNGRDSTGRFAAGNAGGPGRPRRAVEREFLSALSDAISLEDWQDIVKTAVAAAKQGDSRARDWVTRYV